MLTNSTTPTTTAHVVRIAPRLFGAVRTDGMIDGATVTHTRKGVAYRAEYQALAAQAPLPALDEIDYTAFGA